MKEGRTMRAKMIVESVTQYAHGQENLKLRAVSKNTVYPEDGIEISITNPELLGEIKAGDTFYVDFIKAE